jgi:hypothetical protein
VIRKYPVFSQVNPNIAGIRKTTALILSTDKKAFIIIGLIKKTAKTHPNFLGSAYKDNVAFIEGPRSFEFAPKNQDRPDDFMEKAIDTVISIKAETHNFPTTVEPFNGAATGSGGEYATVLRRDRQYSHGRNGCLYDILSSFEWRTNMGTTHHSASVVVSIARTNIDKSFEWGERFR